MTKEAYDWTQGDVTSVDEVAVATAVVGHEQNASLPATETMEGYVEAFYNVDRNGGAIGTYEDEGAPELPANSIPTEILWDITEAKVGSGTLKVTLGGSDVITGITTADTDKHADPGSFRSATASAIEFVVASNVITAGTVRVRVKYLRGGPNA